MMDDFDAYLAEQMRDPVYRFWHYVYAPGYWLRGKLISFLFWLRDVAHEAGCQVIGVRLVDVSSADDDTDEWTDEDRADFVRRCLAAKKPDTSKDDTWTDEDRRDCVRRCFAANNADETLTPGVHYGETSLTDSLGPTEASAAGPILTSGDDGATG